MTGTLYVSIYSLKKHTGLAEQEIPVLVYGYYAFSKTLRKGLPDSS
jgi:hypothetical protein